MARRNPPGWSGACRREAAIRDLLDRHPERVTISAVESIAWELGFSRPTAYRLIARYRLTRTVEGLRGSVRGRRAGTRILDPAEETLIREILEGDWRHASGDSARADHVAKGGGQATRAAECSRFLRQNVRIFAHEILIPNGRDGCRRTSHPTKRQRDRGAPSLWSEYLHPI